MVSKGHPLKKYYQLQKQKIKTMWSCMIFQAQNLVPTQDDHPRFSELKLMSKSRGLNLVIQQFFMDVILPFQIQK
jgi:hypothetical protein